MAALIGALRASLSANTTAFETGMRRAQRSADKTAGYIRTRFGAIGTSLKSSLAGLVGAVTVGTVVAAGKAALEYAGHLGELADTLGLTTRDLQTFSYAAGQVGISQEELEAGIQKLTISMGKAQLGSKAQVEAFNAIGISIDQLKGKDAGDVFRLIAEKLEKVEDRSKRAAVEVALFGKAGAKLDNLLSGSQGRLSDLAAAAERLGIVLSDEQIQKADETADKLEALKTVLEARLAGVVADNADSILKLADAFAEIVRWAGQAANLIGKVANAINSLPAPPGWFGDLMDKVVPGSRGIITAAQVASQPRNASTITVKLPPAKSPTGGGGQVSNFLAGGGGGGKKDHSAEDAERKRLEALRKAYDFARDQNSADRDILEAKRDLAHDYSEQTTLSIAILDKEKEAFDLELQYSVASKDRTQAEADILKAKYEQKDALERQKILDEEQAKRASEFQELRQHDFERQREILSAQADIAETASERRKVELEILRLAYEQKRQALQNIIETSKNFQEQEDARRDLENLDKTYPLAQQGVMQSTRGPLESYLASLPTTAAKWNEALQQVAVNGLQSLEDGLMSVIDGTKSVGAAFKDMAKGIIADLLRISIQKAIIGPLANMLFGGGMGGGGLLGGLMGGATGGGGGFWPGSAAYPNWTASFNAAVASGSITRPGFASGGAMVLGGHTGIDRNVLSMNGLPIARVSRGETMHITPDAMPRGGVVIHAPITITSPVSRETAGQLARDLSARIAQSRTKGISR